VFLASRGQRDLGGGREQIVEMEDFVQILNQARSVFRRSFLYAAVLTVIILLFP